MLTYDIVEAYKKSHFSEVELEAHTLGSAAATCGAFELETICRDIGLAQPVKNKVFNDHIERLSKASANTIQAFKNYAE